MTLKVVFRPASRAEFDGATLWYEDRQPGPDRYSVKHKEIRCIRARRFPYSIFYTVESRQIVVLAVFHARRDPTVWQARA
jgi:hypothetical protein